MLKCVCFEYEKFAHIAATVAFSLICREKEYQQLQKERQKEMTEEEMLELARKKEYLYSTWEDSDDAYVVKWTA